jgi:enediyne biosynthesis protein E4
VYGLVARDVDGDGITDLMLAGNFDGFKPDIARTSDSYGLVLRGSKSGAFTALPHLTSGFVVPGQSREILRVRSRTGDLFVVARNNDRPLVFRLNRSKP